MTLKKILFISTILLLLINLIILNTNQVKQAGIINTIKYSNNKITITLTNNSNNYIIFTNELINIKKEDKVKIIGQQSTYKNQPQIIVHKLIKIHP